MSKGKCGKVGTWEVRIRKYFQEEEMIVMPLNVIGVGGTRQFYTFRRLFDTICPDVIFIQETMVATKKSMEVFKKNNRDWDICATYFVGQ